MRWLSLTLSLLMRGIANPVTGLALVRLGWRFRRRDWWKRAPFLPLPSMTYVRWRMHTAYGDHHAVPPAADVERYARWAAHQ